MKNEYKYDVAISLCKEDLGFAKKLVKEINPKLEIFLYTERQSELIGKTAQREFSKVFKEQSRVVVILYRNKWGKTYYTELEESAIFDRTKNDNERWNFITVVTMENGETPIWYPSSKIYLNPLNFTPRKIAEFIEYKVNEGGGDIEPLTYEDHLEHYLDQKRKRKELIDYLCSQDSWSEAMAELDRLGEFINEKIDYTQSRNIGFASSQRKVNTTLSQSRPEEQISYLQLGSYRLLFIIRFIDQRTQFSQGFSIYVELQGPGSRKSIPYLTLEEKLTAFEHHEYKYKTDLNNMRGWAEVISVDRQTAQGQPKLYFRVIGSEVYDLGEIIATENLLDTNFSKLFELAKEEYCIE